LLIIQWNRDMNIPMSMPHNFILRVGKETDHALGVVKAFVAQPVDGIYRRNACRLTYRVQCRSLSVRWR